MSTNGKYEPRNSKVDVVLGAMWGDEGKGKVTDMLACHADVVCRCQGGNNCGHRVVVEGIRYNHELIPVGVLQNHTVSIIGNGVVINIPDFFEEMKEKEREGLAKLEGRLYISDKAHIVFDFHQTVDGLQEKEKGTESLGTTKRGIGPTYSSKANRTGLRLSDLVGDFAVFEKKFRNLVRSHANQYSSLNVNVDREIEKYKEYARSIAPFVTDTVAYLQEAIKAGKKILVEGANGAMLDIDFGSYPYVTSSNTTIGGVITGLGINLSQIGEVYGVVKAYTTRLGKGPFPTENAGALGEALQTIGEEMSWKDRWKYRCGWLDAVILRYTTAINGYTAIALTKLDILDTFEEIKICVAYHLKGKRLQFPPTGRLQDVEPEYISLPGWQTSIAGVRQYRDLPCNAKRYVETIEDLLRVPVKWIGVGKDRSAMLQVF